MPEGSFVLFGLADLLLNSGWAWSRAQLRQVTEWLARQGIKQRQDLVELCLHDLEDIGKWSVEVCAKPLLQ